MSSAVQRFRPKHGESLADLFPGLAAEWDSERNDGLSPSDVSASIYKRVWWQCREGLDHQWAAPIADRAKRNRGCPSCAGQKVSVTNSLATIASDVAQEWHPSKNGSLKPDGIVAKSNKNVWWSGIAPPASSYEGASDATLRV